MAWAQHILAAVYAGLYFVALTQAQVIVRSHLNCRVRFHTYTTFKINTTVHLNEEEHKNQQGGKGFLLYFSVTLTFEDKLPKMHLLKRSKKEERRHVHCVASSLALEGSEGGPTKAQNPIRQTTKKELLRTNPTDRTSKF